MVDRNGKSDMERIGLFQEMAYTTIGDRYKSGQNAFNEAAIKGRQMFPGGSKVNSALQHGYFDVKFNRAFEGEAYSDPVALRRRFRKEQRKRDIGGRPFLPANGPKMVCGLGNFYGTIGGSVSAMSPLLKGRITPLRVPGKNVITNPGKQGTGYGYANVALSPYPLHSLDPYTSAREKMQAEVTQHKKLLKGGALRLNLYPEDYFQLNPYRIDKALPPTRKPKHVAPPGDNKPFRPSSPGKKSGGGKFGTFDPYPTHPPDVYSDKIPRPINVMNSSGKQYGPPPGPKTRPVNSVIAQNVIRSMNIKNYRTMTSVY
ncbi:hypothetical protein ACOMHN_042775 [Nucella lapillus]